MQNNDDLRAFMAESALLEPTVVPSEAKPANEVDALQEKKNLFDKTLDKLESTSRPLIQWWSGSPKQVNADAAAVVFPVLQQNWYYRRSYTSCLSYPAVRCSCELIMRLRHSEQTRLLRLETDFIVRLHADTLEQRARKRYTDLKKIEKLGGTWFCLEYV
jgi:hypothetical protein